MRLIILFFSLTLAFNSKSFSDYSIDSKFAKKEVAIIQLSFDGICTYHCGVGTVVKQAQSILAELNLNDQNNCYSLYLVSGSYCSKLPEYSAAILERNIQECQRNGGNVLLIPITKKDQIFGDVEQWEELCEQGAQLCAQIVNEHKHTIILAHDTAFAQIPLKLSELVDRGEIKNEFQAVWIPHATSWSYNGHNEEGVPNWPQRHNWELEAFKKASSCNYKIGYICPSMKDLMTGPPFNVSEDVLFHYRTGILLDKYLASIPEDLVATELKSKSIPLDKRLIFSLGRANPLKGLDITLEIYRHLKAYYSDIHLVLLAPESDFMPEYLQQLKRRIKNEKLDVTLLDQFDSEIAHYMYQWPNTAVVSLLSRMDTQPLTIMEARVNPKNCIVLASDPERNGKQVTHEINGFTCSINGLEEIIEQPLFLSGPIEKAVSIARQALDLNDSQRKLILENGRKLIKEQYDFRENMKENIKNIFNLKINN